MIISTMLSGHVDGVKALLDICFGDSAWSIESIRSQMEKPASICTVALKDDTVIGYLAFEQILDEGSIAEIAVCPDFRRQGIAKRLIAGTLDDRNDLSEVFLEVREGNDAAIALYESLGFERIGMRKDYYDHPKENAIMMRKNL